MRSVSWTIRNDGRLRHTPWPDSMIPRNLRPGRETAIKSPVLPTVSREWRCDDRRVWSSVLIVDDDPAFLALAARIVTELGVDVVATAGDAAQALKVVQDARPDGALVDIGLPDRDGIDLAYELSELPWRPRVVLTSSDSDAFLAIETCKGLRRLAFIAKEELTSDTLRRVLNDV
jgi:CheY-like chemotaxis protein